MSRNFFCSLFLILFFSAVYPEHGQHSEFSRDSLQAYLAEARTTIYNDFTAAIDLLEEAETIAARSSKSTDMADVRHLYAVAYYVKGSYECSLQDFLEAQEIYRLAGDQTGVAKCLIGQGLIQQGIDRHEEATSLFERAIAAYGKAGKPEAANPAYLNIAISEIELGRYEQARENLRIASELSMLAGRKDVEHMAINKLGHIYFLEGKTEDAIAQYTLLLEHETEPNGWEKSFAHAGLAEAFIIKKNLILAEEHGKRSMEYASTTSSFWDLERNSKILSNVYRERGNFAQAYDLQLVHQQYKDSLYNQSKLREVNFLQLESKEADNLRLQAEKEVAEQQLLINRGFIVAMILIILFLLILVFLFRSNSRQKELFTRELEQKNETILRQNKLISRHNEELKEINSSKDHLFSILSHDLRSPIGSIQQLLELIKSGEFSREEQDDLLDEMLSQVKGTSIMLHNLLYWASGQMEGSKVNIQQIDLPPYVSSALDAHYLVARHKNITIDHRLPEDLNPILADAGHLAVILHNLLSNAIKYTREGRGIKIRYEQKSEEVLVKIRDGGEGISEEKIAEIKSFNNRMISKLGTDMETGTGLGLLLVKQFLVANNARLDIKTFPGEGSEFTVVFRKA